MGSRRPSCSRWCTGGGALACFRLCPQPSDDSCEPLPNSYLAAAFLSTALPLGFTFLFDSFRLWRHQYAGSQYGGSSSSFSPQGLTYDIPLHVSARGPLSSEKRNAHHHQSATSLPMHAHSLGVMVSQEHAVVVESSFSKNEKDDADKYSI